MVTAIVNILFQLGKIPNNLILMVLSRVFQIGKGALGVAERLSVDYWADKTAVRRSVPVDDFAGPRDKSGAHWLASLIQYKAVIGRLAPFDCAVGAQNIGTLWNLYVPRPCVVGAKGFCRILAGGFCQIKEEFVGAAAAFL